VPNRQIDPVLFDIVTRNMIQELCGQLNICSPCMKDVRCTKQFPKSFIDETHTGDDSYIKYRRRSPESGGETFVRQVSNNHSITLDNRWIVPYSPLLLHAFDSHINVESAIR